MPSFTKDQQDYCKLAQFSQVHKTNNKQYERNTRDDLVELDDVNLKVLSNRSNKHFVTGSTPLHIACEHKNVEAFESLLERGADFTAINKNGETALHRAACDIFPERASRGYTDDKVEDELIDSVLTAHVEYDIAENPRSADVFNLGLTHFHVACAVDHLEAIQFFLDAGVSVNETVDADSYTFPGYTPLHFAALFSKYEAAKLLLQRGANLRLVDARGSTALHVVIERIMDLKQATGIRHGETGHPKMHKLMEKNQKIARLFLYADKKLDMDNTGFSKLHAASTLSDFMLAQRFLQNIDVNIVINMDSLMWPGYTALHFAVKSNINTAKILLGKGAKIEAKDAKRITPFDLCIEKYNLEDLHSVLSAVPYFKDIKFSDGKTKLMDFIDATQTPFTLEIFFQTIPKDVFLPRDCPLWPGYYLSHLLVRFSKNFNFDLAKIVPKFDGDMMIQQDTYGRTPIHLGFYQQNQKIVDLFFQHGLVTADVIDSNNLSHLHIACERENEIAVQTLLSKSANVNVTYTGKEVRLERYGYYESAMPSGSTPLHIAISRRCKELIKTLLKCGADVNATDDNGITPMHQFIYFKSNYRPFDAEIINELGDLLFSSGKLINIVSHKTGLSHLHVACFANNEKAVENLLKLGADVNAVLWTTEQKFLLCRMTSFVGYTPLHFAVANQNEKLIELLLKRGANILARKPDDMTLLYDALKRGNLKMSDIDIKKTNKFFIPLLAKDAKLRKRMEDDSGLTLLHIACYLGDAELVKSLLMDLQINVDAQIRSNSPIWPSATPLHILIEYKQDIKDLDCLAKLLLEHGANIMLADNTGNTPVHKAWSNWISRNDTQNYELLRLLLRFHEDFNVNPVNEEGISHFHLACFVSEFRSVNKFLERGVDVNLPIDYLNKKLTFQTPLRFTLESFVDAESRLQTIDILLKYGAEVNVQDENGLTPFLKVAYGNSSRRVFFEKLQKAGADVNSTNINGKSVLEILFESRNFITNEELQFFFGQTHLFNSYNSVYGIGITSIAACKKDIMQDQKSILSTLMEIPNLFTVDKIGRTPIHNLVANYKTNLSSEEYAHYIEEFIAMGYDVDVQDFEGKTALHLAAYFRNDEALSALLLAGADLNITDNENRTAIVIQLEHRSQDYKDMFVAKLKNIPRLNPAVVLQSITMILCDLELNDQDFAVMNFLRSIDKYRCHCEGVMKEIETTKLVTIGTGSLKLSDFLSETGAVASRPSMISYSDHEAVRKFFESSEVKRFPLLNSVLKLQYRKTLNRLQLIDPATESLKHLVGGVNGFCLPDLCCRIILRFLSNTEVKNLTISVSEDKTMD